MRKRFAQLQARRGAIAPLTALLMIPTLAIVAFAVDVGWLVVTQSDLQNSADAAALAGADRLIDGFVQYHLPGQNQQGRILADAQREATGYAQQYAGYNRAGGVRSLVLHEQDVEFGFTDERGNYTPRPQYRGYPNTIKVRLHRNAEANGSVPLFFAPLLGRRHADLSVTAAATIYTGIITNFRNDSPFENKLLPLALDFNNWASFYETGLSPDGMLHPGPQGGGQLKAYPSPQSTPGNFGLLNVGPPGNGTPLFRGWINHGPSSSDIRFLRNAGQLPVAGNGATRGNSPHGAKHDVVSGGDAADSSGTWPGTPGLRSTLVSDFANILDEPRLLPVFEPISSDPYQAASGNGSHARYHVVGFVGVKITQATGSGSNMDISVQPAAILDSAAIYTHVKPAGTSSHILNTFVPPKLTQ